MGDCTYFVFGKIDVLNYDVYRTEHEWILDRIWEAEIKGKVNEGAADCTKEWSAVKALRNKNGVYYVRFEDTILIFSDKDDFYPTVEQIQIICEKLNVR